MSRINQDIVEYGFSLKSTLSYELSVLVGADSVYCMVNDAQSNVLALRSYHFDMRQAKVLRNNIQEVFFEDELLREPYRVTKVAFSSQHATLVPDKLFDKVQRNAYFEHLIDFNAFDEVSSDAVQAIEAHNVYVVDQQLITLMQSYFPAAKYYHVFTALIQGFRKIAELRTGHQVFLNIRDGVAQVFFFDAGALIFANAFAYQTVQDVLYYLLMIYEQFKLNPEVIPLTMSGSMTEDTEVYKIIYRYVRHVSFVQPPPYFRFGNQFVGVPTHFYFDLFSIKICE